jgi:hypothetical protein
MTLKHQKVTCPFQGCQETGTQALTELAIWTIIYTRGEGWDVRISSPICRGPGRRRESMGAPFGIDGAEEHFREES